MRLVLFLGAGFSARFGLPVMNDFLSFVHTSKVVKDEDKAFLGRLIIEARQANSFLQSSPVNLEDLLTFAMMGDRLGFGLDDGGLRGDRVRRILQRAYTEIRRPAAFWTEFDDFTRFLNVDLHNRQHELTIVTTNYDLMAECGLHHTGKAANPGVPFKPIMVRGSPTVNPLYTDKGVLVLKLHGSVNWYLPADGSEGIEVDGRFTKAQDLVQNWPVQIDVPMALYVPDGEPRPPVIVPPSFLKPDMSRPLAEVWSKAAAALRSARRVVFVGYSFPPSDMEMKYFLARSLVDNPDLEYIEVIDPNADMILARIKDAASGYGTHFRDFLRGEACRWAETKLDWR